MIRKYIDLIERLMLEALEEAAPMGPRPPLKPGDQPPAGNTTGTSNGGTTNTSNGNTSNTSNGNTSNTSNGNTNNTGNTPPSGNPTSAPAPTQQLAPGETQPNMGGAPDATNNANSGQAIAGNPLSPSSSQNPTDGDEEGDDESQIDNSGQQAQQYLKQNGVIK